MDLCDRCHAPAAAGSEYCSQCLKAAAYKAAHPVSTQVRRPVRTIRYEETQEYQLRQQRTARTRFTTLRKCTDCGKRRKCRPAGDLWQCRPCATELD